ncbi:MAG: S8 family serine peptidase, partial [bacterium]
DCSRDDLARLASLSFVMSMEEWHPAEAENANCQWVAQTWTQNQRRVWDQGLFGEGEILGYSDGQLDHAHHAMYDPAVTISDTGEFPTHRKIVVLKKYPPARLGSSDSHGSHVGGTIAGNDSVNGGTNANDGHSKAARLVQLSPIPQPTGNDFTVPLNTISNYLRNPELRPHTMSHSWWTLTKGQYTNAAATFDNFSWHNKDIQQIKSCGNQGQSAQYQITEPGNSKSIISAASVQNGTSSTVLSTYSSRGPAPDGRIKPDISVPGEAIMSARYRTTNDYTSMSGTSMSAPAINGNIGLLRNYLRKGFYPTGAANAADTFGYVSAALLKAMVLVSADPNIGSYVVPSEYIGWGRIDLDSVLFFSTPSPDVRKLLLDDDTTGLATGEYVEYQFLVTDSIPLRVAVVWTDTAAAAGANPALINDLNCLLTGPDASFYKGCLYTGGVSTPNPGGAYDSRNPNEMFRVNRPAPGTWTLRVSAQNVVTQRQPFAVVATGAFSTERHDVGVSRIIAPVGRIDSGTVVTPACSVYNYGTEVETYQVSIWVQGYTGGTADVTDHAPGTAVRVALPSFTADTLGQFAVKCSTMLAGDASPGNDTLSGSFTVRRPIHDVGVTAIHAPVDTVEAGTEIAPRALVENFGSYTESFAVWFAIERWASVDSLTLAPGAVDTAVFETWTAGPVGTLVTTCYSMLPGDADPSNDTAAGRVVVLPGTGIEELGAAPQAYALARPVPTPFAGRMTVRYALPRAGVASVAVYNSAGRLVRTLASGSAEAGYHFTAWDGRDEAGTRVAPGVYYCRMSAGEFRAMRKLVKLD